MQALLKYIWRVNHDRGRSWHPVAKDFQCCINFCVLSPWQSSIQPASQQSNHLFIYPPIYPSLHPSIHLSTYSSTHLSNHIDSYLFIGWNSSSWNRQCIHEQSGILNWMHKIDLFIWKTVDANVSCMQRYMAAASIKLCISSKSTYLLAKNPQTATLDQNSFCASLFFFLLEKTLREKCNELFHLVNQ